MRNAGIRERFAVTAICSATLCAGLLPAAGIAATVGWRTDGTGRYPTAAPQTKWGPKENVLWATVMPQWGNATPVVVGDKIIAIAEPSVLICLDRGGMIVWTQEFSYADLPVPAGLDQSKAADLKAKVEAKGKDLAAKREQFSAARKASAAEPSNSVLKAEADKLDKDVKSLAGEEARLNDQLEAYVPPSAWRLPKTHKDNGYGSDTPVSDGKFIYASLGSGLVGCTDLDGKRQWVRFLEKTKDSNGHSCSPVLAGGLLIVHFIDMFALDPATGQQRWRTKHPHFFGTPAVVRVGERDVLFTDAGEVVNAADGQTLATTRFKMEFGSPLLQDGVAYCANNDLVSAFQLEASGATVTAKQLWQTTVNKERYYAAPLLHEGLLYVMNQKSVLSVLDAKTGALVYEKALDLRGIAYTSPVLAGDVILLASEGGRTVVLTPGREFKEVARCALEPLRSTPVCDGARMYIRTCAKTDSKLYCIGK